MFDFSDVPSTSWRDTCSMLHISPSNSTTPNKTKPTHLQAPDPRLPPGCPQAAPPTIFIHSTSNATPRPHHILPHQTTSHQPIRPPIPQNGHPFVHYPPSPPPKSTHKTHTYMHDKPAPPDRRPIVISGPSGVGKGTLYKRLFDSHPDTFCLSVSHTTRGPRPGEQDGVDYHYVTMEAFEDLIAKDGFVEHAKFGGNRYGTSKMTIEEQTNKGKVVLLDIEMEARNFKREKKRKEKKKRRNAFCACVSGTEAARY